MRATLGVNAKLQGISLEPFLEWNGRARPVVNVQIDEPKAAAAQMAQGTQVIYRWSGDDHAHERYDAAQFVARLHAEAPAGCVLQLGNEPGRESLDRLNAWTLAALDACERVGRKAALFAFSTGEPERVDWKRLRPSVLRAAAGGHWVNLHEYFDGFVERSAPAHVGRFTNVYSEFGSQTPQIVIGELGCAVGGNPYAGWQTYLTAEQYAVELAAAQAIYRERGIPACVFVYGPWDRTTTFDIRGESGLLDAMAAINAQEDSDMAGPPGWKQATTGPKGVNLRPAPSLKSTPIMVIRTGDWIRRLPGGEVRADGKTWAPVALERDAATHVHGWVATEVIEV